MNFLKSKKTGVWSVRFQTKTGWKQLGTGQTDFEKAKLVAKEANIEGIELSRLINLVANAASMHALCGRIVKTKVAFKEWYENLKATHPPNTTSRYHKIVQAFLRRLGWPGNLSAIRASDIDKWVNVDPETCPMHAQTRNVHRAALSSFFKFCANEGWCGNPVANVKLKRHLLTHAMNESKHRRPFTPGEFERLIEVAKAEPSPYWYCGIMIARHTGLRWGDVQRMETACIQADRIVVWTDKRDRRVEIPMPEQLPPVFDMLAKHPLNQPIKSSLPGRLFNQRPVEVWGGAWRDFKRLLEAAGLPLDLSLHALRHTYAVELAKSNIPLQEIAKRMGHFGDATTLHYLRALVQ